MKAPLPFTPETEEAALFRFQEALTPDYEVMEVAMDLDRAPSKLRKHVFDFRDGIRMIASVDRHRGQRLLHFSFSYHAEGQPERAKLLHWFKARCVELCWTFSGRLVIKEQAVQSAVALHYWIDAPKDPKRN